ncbi:hypothetical protein SISNIDRAFT_525950 [Sistotremastrum niveocremeum HHB9708]|uniref:Uncharacterized protein n=1 Tax=Sistotremastrum niveocremeum HHB9708 TaxID=1314777 RepID=A0A164QJJ5_9AGAM|nr:hypothetical protein SISNIDRAFT_525950 [Sistotremastrum niveocremeum HHB9708]
MNAANLRLPVNYPNIESIIRCVQQLQLRVGIVSSLYTQYRGRSCFKIILLVVIMTFANSTVVFVLTSYNISTQFQLAPSVFASNSAFQCDPDPEPRYLRPLFMLQMLTVDSFTIYRTWLLYNKRSSVIIFPILCALVLFGSILCNIPSVPVFNSTFLHYYLTIPISLTLNTLCTGLIAIRLRRVHLETFQVIKFSPSQFVVLSGTIHNLVLFLLFLSVFVGWKEGITLIGPILITCTAAITFDFLVLQIALSKAFLLHETNETEDAVSVRESVDLERKLSFNSITKNPLRHNSV